MTERQELGSLGDMLFAHAAAVETQREKEEALAKAEAELKDLRSRPVEVAVETRTETPEVHDLKVKVYLRKEERKFLFYS